MTAISATPAGTKESLAEPGPITFPEYRERKERWSAADDRGVWTYYSDGTWQLETPEGGFIVGSAGSLTAMRGHPPVPLATMSLDIEDTENGFRWRQDDQPWRVTHVGKGNITVECS